MLKYIGNLLYTHENFNVISNVHVSASELKMLIQ